MKNRRTFLLLSFITTFFFGNIYSYHHSNHNSFIAGTCAVGAALIGAAGVAALIDWCCSETDDQLIERISNECYSISSQYKQPMNYFGQLAGVGGYAPHRPIQHISETALFEFTTFVWNSGISQIEYHAGVWTAKERLQSGVRELRKRILSRENQYNPYEDQKRLATMKDLLYSADQLLADISLFADCLECHKSYFILYDSVGKIRNRYSVQIAILESGRYSISAEIKQSVLSYDSSQYAFRNFIKSLEADISTLGSNVRSLEYNYDAGRRYAHQIIDQLIIIKNIVVTDPRYQDELYRWEQACLERQRIKAFENQVELDRERARIERERNRLMEKQIQLERQKLYAQPVMVRLAPAIEEVSVTVSF